MAVNPAIGGAALSGSGALSGVQLGAVLHTADFASVRLNAGTAVGGAAALRAPGLAAAPLGAQLQAPQASPILPAPAGAVVSGEQSAGRALAPAAESFGATVRGVAKALAPENFSTRVSLSSSYGAGAALEAAVTRRSVATAAEAVAGPRSAGVRWGKPAGADIARAVEAGYTGDPETPPVPSWARVKNTDGPGPIASFLSAIPRYLAAIAFLTPAVVVAWPLIQAGTIVSVAGGVLLALTSITTAATPLMGAQTKSWARSLPGFSMIALGIVTMQAAFLLPLAWVPVSAAFAMGAFTAFNGWSLLRIANSETDTQHRENKEVMATFFGSIGAMTGAGVVLNAVLAGTAVSMTTVLAFPLALVILTGPMAIWAGAGYRAVADRLVLYGFRGVHSVMESVDTDTVRGRRLNAMHHKAMQQSALNELWLSIRMLPALADRVLQKIVTVVAGTWAAAWHAPIFFAWGAAHHIAPQSQVSVFLANWARFTFDNVQGSKVRTFNAWEEPFIPMANSANWFDSFFGAAAIRVAQGLWVVWTAVKAPLMPLAGLIHAIAQIGQAYDPYKHSPEKMDLDKDPLPGKVPHQPLPEKVAEWPWKLVAAAIGLIPFAYFGWPVFVAALAGNFSLSTAVYPLAALLVGLMPLLPNTRYQNGTPQRLLRTIPGVLLMIAGAGMFIAGYGMVLGGLATIGGFGLAAYAWNLTAWGSHNKATLYTYAAMLVVTAAMGSALIGLVGPVATLLSFALYATILTSVVHGPRFFAKGVKTVYDGVKYSVRGIHGVLNSWAKDTDFDKNLDAAQDHWIRQSRMNGSWTWLAWVPTRLTKISEWAVAVAAGLAMYDAVVLLKLIHIDLGLLVMPFIEAIPFGAPIATALGVVLGSSLFQITVAGFLVTTLGLRAASLFAWGALHETAPTSRVARFFAGFTRSFLQQSEGSKSAVYDPTVASFREMMSRRSALTGGPTATAFLGLLGSRLLQGVWLPRMVLMLPVNLVKALIDGVANATEPRDKWAPPKKEDDPDVVLNK